MEFPCQSMERAVEKEKDEDAETPRRRQTKLLNDSYDIFVHSFYDIFVHSFLSRNHIIGHVVIKERNVAIISNQTQVCSRWTDGGTTEGEVVAWLLATALAEKLEVLLCRAAIEIAVISL
jgi:hypothetical protein